MAITARGTCDFTSKVVFVGASEVGKSQLLQRIREEKYTDSYIATIGIDFAFKTVSVGGKAIKLQLWDLAGQERFRAITHAYYRGTKVIALVVDATKSLAEQQTAIDEYCDSIKQHADLEAVPILVVNKWNENEEKTPQKLTTTDIEEIEEQMQRMEIDRHRGVEDYTPPKIHSVWVSAKKNTCIGMEKGGLLGLIANTSLAIFQKCQSLLPPEPDLSAARPPCTRRPAKEHQAARIKELFGEAKSQMSAQCAALTSPFTSASATDFKTFLDAAEIQVLADHDSGTITFDDATKFAQGAKTLAGQVANHVVTGENISAFLKEAEPAIRKSDKLGRIVGAIIGAALGVFIGVMIGVFAPPAGAFAALALGKAGAVAGAAVGGLIVGYLGSKLGNKLSPKLFQPGARMARAAKGTVKGLKAAEAEQQRAYDSDEDDDEEQQQQRLGCC